MLQDFLHNFSHNLFKPLLLFFYAGFLIPILRIKFEFPKPVYQALTIYLLLAIGWKGGEELASLEASELRHALGFMGIGFVTNTIIGIVAYFALRNLTRLRHIDAATVAGYYGSDSAGTFVTATGVLAASQIAYAAYMPVMLAIMEIPGCLVALFIVSRLRNSGMDQFGNMPNEVGYQGQATGEHVHPALSEEETEQNWEDKLDSDAELVVAGVARQANSHSTGSSVVRATGHGGKVPGSMSAAERYEGESLQAELSMEPNDGSVPPKSRGLLDPQMLHEVFLNPGIFLLFAGITIGFIARLQGKKVIEANDVVFVNLFPGLLCVFLLEMGMTASNRLRDLRAGGLGFIAFGLIAPNVFAATAIGVAHAYSLFLGTPFALGTYVLFAVLCGAASYIALPAVQRMAIPEASPTLPLAASLGLTFSYNVTVGIPLYTLMATAVIKYFPVHAI